MASGGTSLNIYDHGVSVDKKKGRVRCNYCEKEMSGITRLKRHLGGIRKDVAPCQKVPDNVGQAFRSMMLEESHSPTCDVTSSVRSGHRHESGPDADSSASEDYSSEGDSLLGVKRSSQSDKHDLLSKKAQKCMGRFFYENGVDFSAVNSPSFKEMLNAASSGSNVGQLRYKIPSSQDLSGWILQEEVKETEEYVKRIKDSWEITGCSILLDAWVDVYGRDLVTFIADCPQGPVYLKSCDVSNIKNDMIPLVLLIDEVVEEVGAHNVIQVIGCSVSGWVGELGKWFAENNREFFWSVSVSHCIELMLEKIGKMDAVIDVVNNVNKILEFINSDPLILKLFRDYSHRKDQTILSNNDSATPYVKLKSILAAKKYLLAMFASSDWKNMIWASTEEGITVARLMEDSSFWNNAETVRNCMIPLVRDLSDKAQVGLIYDQMDKIKEKIAKELCHNKLSYKPYWDIIDEVWDTHLHSPLHAAGYFLNPCAFYSTDFLLDPEVAAGLVSTLIYMVKEQSVQLKVVSQLDMYRLGQDSFFEASRVDKISGCAPAEWWARYADQHPELQRVAIKILSQTCEGASRYRLKRRVAEELLAGGNSHFDLDQKHLNNFAFVHYNLHLRQCKLRLDAGDPVDDAAADRDRMKIERFLFE